MNETNRSPLDPALRAVAADPYDVDALGAFDRLAARHGVGLADRLRALCSVDAADAAYERLNAARVELRDRAQAARVSERDAARAAGTLCAACGGRGSVCTWGTLDSLTGDFDEYGTCEACRGQTALDLSRWCTTADGRQRMGRGLLTLPEGWEVVGVTIFDAAQVAEHRELERIGWMVADAQNTIKALLTPQRGSRVILVKGRPKNKRTGETVKVGARGWLKWERPAGSDFDGSVGFILDGTEDMVFTNRANLRTESVGEERTRRAAATVEREAKLAQVKERDLFVGAIVRGTDGRTGEVFWIRRRAWATAGARVRRT